MTHRDDEGELFDLPTFFQRIFDLPTPPKPSDPDDLHENYNECLPTETSQDSSTKLDNDGVNEGVIDQNQHQITMDHFVKASMEQSTSRDLNSESGDTGENRLSCLVQKPLSGNGNEGKFETFKDEGDSESRTVNDPSLGQKSEARIEEAFFGSDLTTVNIECNYESIDPFHQSSFSEVIEGGESRIFYDSSLGSKTEAASLGDNQNTENLEVRKTITEEKSRTVNDPSLGQKSEAHIEDSFLVSSLTKENLDCNYESIDSLIESVLTKTMEVECRIFYDPSLGLKTEAASLGNDGVGDDRNTENPDEVRKTITQENFRIGNDPSFGLKSRVSVEEEPLLGNYRTAGYSKSVQSDVEEDKSRNNNDASLGLKTIVSVEETLPDCNPNTKNPDEIRKAIPEGSSSKEDIDNNPSLEEKDEYTDYYPTPYTTMMSVIQNDETLDEDQILRCKIGFTCNFCGHSFRSRDELREHKRGYASFVPSGARVCSRYSQRYCIVSGYNSSKQVQFKCSHCQKRFKSFGDYARHCNNEQVCKRHRSYLVSPFVLHCELDNGEMGFECLLCQESSAVYAELKFHECVISRELPEDDPPGDEDCDDEDDDSVKCDLCGVEFRNRPSYDEHHREHVIGRKYECKVCYQTFNRICSFKTHMADSHKVKTRERKCRSAKRKP